MNLDPTLTLLATLGGAVSANQPEVHVSYTVYNRIGETAKPAQFRVALNSTSDVTLLAAPPQELVYVVNGLSLYNKDTTSVTALLKTTDGSTQRIICRVILSTLESLHYSDSSDTWIVLTATGAVKASSGISGPASSTNNGFVRWNGTSATVVQDTSDITYDGTTYIIGSSKFTVASSSGNTLVGGNLTVSGTGPHAIGGATNADVQLYLRGTFTGTTNAFALFESGTLVPGVGGDAVGIYAAPTLNKAGSGTHSNFASVLLDPPAIVAGAATLTNATTLKITGAPSVGTNQRALWVAAGSSQFDGGVSASNLTAWTSWNPTRTGWTDVGSPTVTARYCQIVNVIYFQIKIVPSTTTAAVGGTSYVSLPTSINSSAIGGDGSMMNETTLIGIGNVVFDVANSRCYVPAQAATGNTLSIAGWYEV